MNYTNNPRINELYNLIDPQIAHNINPEAFSDIAQVLLSFHDQANKEGIKHVCESSPGHGKTTALIQYLKWITQQDYKQPVLIACREKELAYKIYNEVNQFSPNSIVNIDADNKNNYQGSLSDYQIVIIQHQRLRNFALGYGNLDHYKTYKTTPQKECGNAPKGIKQLHTRLLIIDEKPDFIDSAIFDINSHHNVLDWFEDLSKPLDVFPNQLQRYKSYITFLLSEQLAENLTDKTTSLFAEFKDTTPTKNLVSILNEMKEHEDNQHKYESLNMMKHFVELLNTDNYGRIDDYEYKRKDRKIIVSKYIDYGNLGMNILILDGTARLNGFQYSKGKYDANGLILTNRNNYKRLHYHIDEISTTKYSRDKENHSTQKTISKRVKELRKKHNNIFILPMKEEIPIYISEGAIVETDIHYYKDNELNQSIGINLLNTVGKNVLENKTSLYLTCLPKKHPDYYKCLGIALDYDVNLLHNEETDNGNWFKDKFLEDVYRGELYSEIVQIIHRTALRNINGKDDIHIYIAYNEERDRRYIMDSFTMEHISLTLQHYLKRDMVVEPSHKLIDLESYKRKEKVIEYAQEIKEAFSATNKDEIRLSKVNKSFQKFIENHWNKKVGIINDALSEFNYKIIIKKDRYSDKSKYIIKI